MSVSTSTPVKRVLQRRWLDSSLDWLRFRLDTFPRSGPLTRLSGVGYQPLPWAGIDRSRRAEGSWSRWAAIEAALDEHEDLRTATDLGANVGFFTVKLAQRGLATLAVENDEVANRTALYSVRRAAVPNVGVLMLELNPDTLELLAPADVVIFLSLWHHFVREYGLTDATALLRGIWKRTRRVLFFETGEDEMPSDYGLPPMEPDARTWLTQFLAETCEGSEIAHLGEHVAFDADGAPARRNLFAVTRL
jgi:hypothetical protein